MKTIFLSIYDPDAEKNILQSKILETLREADVRIVILARHGMKDKYTRYASGNVVLEELPPSARFSELAFYWLGWNAIPTNSIRMRRHESYLKNKNLLRYVLGTIVGWLGHLKLFRACIRFAYALVQDDYAAELFKQYGPDVLFAPNMFSYEDGRLLRAAKRRKIPSVTTSKSWDVLTNKAFTRVIADRMLVQNESIRQAAITFGDYPPSHVLVTGFIQFDYVADKSLLKTREEFFKEIGADPSRKLILYATSGDWKNPYDDEVVEGIHQAIMDGSLSAPAQILARFHPKYPSKIEKLDLPYLIKDRPGGAGKGIIQSIDGVAATEYDFSFNKEDVAHLANSIYHSDVTINTTSTMTLDAVAYDKPVVLISHDGFDRKLPYWQSLRRMFDEDHYRQIVSVPCAQVTKSMQETVEAVDTYLKDPARDVEGRAQLRDEFLGTLDGRVGERMARAVLEMVGS